MIGFSICTYCKHFVSIKKSKKGHSYCSAYPNGIPNNIIHSSSLSTHEKVISGQTGNTTFEYIDGERDRNILKIALK